LIFVVYLIIGSIWAAPKVSAGETEEPVHFEDHVLKNVVEEALGIPDPTPTDMLSLTTLYTNGLGIVNLTGLEHATNLRSLGLYSNRISDLTPLAELVDLNQLGLSNNEVRDISGLAELRNLVYLDLGWNKIIDISALAELRRLERLVLTGNKISNIAPLTELENLADLDLGNNMIGDISALAGLTKLERLDFRTNAIIELSPLSDLTKLQDIVIGSNPIRVIGPLVRLRNLKTLFASQCQIVDISALTELRSMERLSFWGNEITDIDPISNMKNLKELSASYNKITDISSIARLSNLQHLDLSSNQIIDIPAISGLTSLTYLDLSQNRISNIDSIHTMTSLADLRLSNNRISDISALSGLSNLEFLYLYGNHISEISALSKLTNLRVLDLRWNPLNYEAYKIYIPMILVNNPWVDLKPRGQEPVPNGRIFFVDDDANSGGDGSSWENAFNSLQDALNAAKYGDEIRVAQGIYKPDQGSEVSTGDRYATFNLKNNVTIMGGYEGITASDPNIRNIDMYRTILSGDLLGDDVGECGNPSMSENSLHVVTGDYTNSTAKIEGFTITSGMANIFSEVQIRGAGIKIDSGSPTIKSCVFVNNYADYGGGLWCLGTGADGKNQTATKLIDCIFTGNHAKLAGGAIYAASWIPITLEDCSITGNSAGVSGGGVSGGVDSVGGIVGGGDDFKLISCVFADNNAGRSGAIDVVGSYKKYSDVIDEPGLFVNNLTILDNDPDAGMVKGAYLLLEGDLNLIEGKLNIISSVLEGNAKIILGEDAQIRISGQWQYEPITTMRTSILGPGQIEVEAGQQLIIEGNAVLNLSGSPDEFLDPNRDGYIIVNGSLVVQGDATIERTNIDVKLLDVNTPKDIQYNNITLLEASIGFGGEFFVSENASIKNNNIISEGDRYLDLDPNPDDLSNPTIKNNLITVRIKEGKLTNQGTLLELRAKDYDTGTVTNPDGNSGAYRVEDSVGFTEDPSENWVLERLELQENAKLNLTNRQGFRYQNPLDPLPETVYVKELVMGPNSVLNTALQTMYYKRLIDPSGTVLLRNPDDPEAPLPNGARFTDIPLLGFSLGIIAMNDQTEFDVRVCKRLTAPEDNHMQPQAPAGPRYIGSIERIDSEKNPSIPAYTGGIMEMRTQAEGKLSASSVAAKGAFARAGDEDINIQFEYIFPENDAGNASLWVYLSDNPEVGHDNLDPIAIIQPPEPGRPGSIESNRFAVFSVVMPHGDLNFCRGTYIELELHGKNAQCWIDNWDPQIYCLAYCGDFNADTEIDPCDYFLLLAEFGLTNPLGNNKACLDMVPDGGIGIDDLFIWDAASEIRCLCPREDSGTYLTSVISNNGYSSQVLSSGRYLDVQEDASLVLFGKRGMGFSRPDGYIYSISQDGKCEQNTSTSGTGRLVADKLGHVYQIHHNEGLLCMGNPQKNINQRIDHDKAVSVGLNESYLNGVPMLDAVFHPDYPGIVYVVPVRVKGTDGRGYKAAAKLKLTSDSISGSDYSVETVYGLDPIDDPNQGITIFSESVRNELLEPDLQHLKEIEIDSRGEYLYVLSSCLHNENNWILVYDEDTGDLEGYVNLSNPCDNLPDINMPTAMVVSSINDRVYLSSSERSDNESGDLTVKVYCFSIHREPQAAAGSTIQLGFDRVIEIQWLAPDESVFERFTGLYEPDRYTSQITSMTEAPDGTLYIVGFTAPRFKEEAWKGEPAFFTQPMLTVIEPDTNPEIYTLNNMELPLSVIWK